MRTEKIHIEGRKLLTSYFKLELTTTSIIADYLAKFEKINNDLALLNGKSLHNIVKFVDDKESLRTLPATLTLYRGYREIEKKEGISWSLSRRVAESFSGDAAIFVVENEKQAGKNLPLGTLNGIPFTGNAYTLEQRAALPSLVVSARCNLLDILAYTNQRAEQEVVVNPSKLYDLEDVPVEKVRLAEIQLQAHKTIAEPLDWLLANKQH